MPISKYQFWIQQGDAERVRRAKNCFPFETLDTYELE